MWSKFFEVVFIGTGMLVLLMALIVVFVIIAAMKFERMRQEEEDGLRELAERNRF